MVFVDRVVTSKTKPTNIVSAPAPVQAQAGQEVEPEAVKEEDGKQKRGRKK